MRRFIVGLIFLAAAAAGIFALAQFMRRSGPPRPPAQASKPVPGKNETIVSVYFPGKEGTDLVEEKRVVPMAGNPSAGINDLLIELHKGPAEEGSRALFPADTFPRTVFLSADGTLYVNYHPKVLETPMGPHDEIMLLRSIAKTLIFNFAEVRALVILVDGAPRHNLGLHMPAHGRYVLPQVLSRKK